jgi:DNA-binding transcriptional ArsR family regulator
LILEAITDLDRYLKLNVEWAPAYELIVSLSCFVTLRKHGFLELGEAWVRDVRERLPPEMATRLTRANAATALKLKQDELLLFLVRACPGERDVASFLGWLEGLSVGDAYEALAPYLPETLPRLPRDFLEWRDRVHEVLSVWDAAYFSTVDPAILAGLAAEAARVRQRLHEPAQALIEELTDGIVVEPGSQPLNVTLIPQWHERPYNENALEQDGLMFLYPADICPPAPDQPSWRLLRLTHALGDDSRLRILRFIAGGPRTLTETARFVGLSQPTVHHHLAQLRAAGLLRLYFVPSMPSRYSLRPHALDQLNQQLAEYLQPTAERSLA